MSPRALAATLPKVTKAVFAKHGRVYGTIVAEWPGLVQAPVGRRRSRRPAPIPHAAADPEVEAQVSEIGDPVLRRSLNRLGNALKRK